eukprot:8571570-Ditylum_brightwellii.AAC.1
MRFILTDALTLFTIGKAPPNHPSLKKKGTDDNQALHDLVPNCNRRLLVGIPTVHCQTVECVLSNCQTVHCPTDIGSQT